MNRKKIIGKLGEDISVEYLQNNNFEVINRNYFCKFGEIDIIAFDKKLNELVFVEVKTRTNLAFGRPIESIDKIKIDHLRKTINYYIIDKKVKKINIRIDAIEVLLKKNKCYIHHIKSII